jgi:hypothetical protein
MGLTFRIRFVLPGDMKNVSDRDEFLRSRNIKSRVARYFVENIGLNPSMYHNAEELWSDISYASGFSGDSVGLAIYVIITPNQKNKIDENKIQSSLAKMCSEYDYFEDVEVVPTDSSRRI